jgi:hypothetical protein
MKRIKDSLRKSEKDSSGPHRSRRRWFGKHHDKAEELAVLASNTQSHSSTAASTDNQDVDEHRENETNTTDEPSQTTEAIQPEENALTTIRTQHEEPPALDNDVPLKTEECDITKDLWKAAAEQLIAKDPTAASRLMIDKDQFATAEMVEKVELSLKQVAQHREDSLKGSSKYKDKTTSMLKSVLVYKGLVDAGLKFDATGYGELSRT